MTRKPRAAALLVVLVAAGCGGSDRDGGEGGQPGGGSWEEQAAAIDGIADYRAERPELLTQGHTDAPVTYQVVPPVGGDHNPVWLNCNGEVYEGPVPDVNAVHSLEHGAVWVTYRPDLAADQLSALAQRVRGQQKMFMSPYPGLDVPISLQAWGYQLKVDDPGDPRIDAFIRALRVNASPEGPTAPCDGGLSG